MRFNNLAFPYPLLDASDPSRDDYIDGGYQVSIKQSEVSEDGHVAFTFNHLCNVIELKHLVKEGKAQYGVLLSCSDTLRREMHLSSDSEQEIKISISELHGRVEMIPQIICVDEVFGFSSEDLNEEYDDIAFDLKPGDVLATDQTIIRFFEFNRLSFETLIIVRTVEDLDPFSYQITLDINYIYIDMGDKIRSLWDELRAEIDKRPFLAMSIYKDCFLHALQELISDDEVMDKRWARALSQKLEENGLRYDENSSLNDLNILAQKLLESESVQKLYQARGAP